MELPAIITVIAILGLVWGGLAFFLTRAMKYEKMKRENGKK
jgi:uncharacterized integral membrane protein